MPRARGRGFHAARDVCSRGTISRDEVHSISLDDIRLGGPARVAEILGGVTGGAFVVVNATDYADLEIVVLGLLEVQEQGKSFGYRCGPSFPRALAGLEPQGPLTAAQIWRTGRPNRRPPARRFGGRLDVVVEKVDRFKRLIDFRPA